ncbi:MAG: thiol reductase thioredoxin [Planctomycetota bacterium]|nr:MAG: thiol reductase thioredoxin [Planctomycetota bacterium]
MNWAAKFSEGLPYSAFLDRYASPDQRRRWDDFYQCVALDAAQKELIGSFTRQMRVIVMAGTWCGDCVNQCPMFEHFSQACPLIDIRYFDRDANADLQNEMSICGGARVPSVVFLSEDYHVCGRYGDRTLSKYRSLVGAGAACSTGIAIGDDLTRSVMRDWLDEFERIQWMLRTSSRLRQLHGD